MSEPANASFQGLVSVTQSGLFGMITLRGDLSVPALQRAVTEHTGLELPGTGGLTGNASFGIGWMSPDELLILCEHSEARTIAASLGKALAGSHHLLAVVSDARAHFTLQGARWRWSVVGRK